MKRKLLIIFSLTLTLACSEKKKSDKSDNLSIRTLVDICGKQKFRLCKRENYYDVSKKHIKLRVPVTDPALVYQQVENISSSKSNINAILIHFLGGPTCTPNQGRIYDKPIPSINFEEIELVPSDLKDSLLVVIFVDDKMLDKETIDGFKLVIENSDSYQQALDTIRDVDDCQSFVEPREQDGDIIGGQ